MAKHGVTKGKILQMLKEESPEGCKMTVIALLLDLSITVTSVQLTRLKKKGVVYNKGGLWYLVK